MITRITKENREKYVKLFAKATEALEKSGVTLVDPITNLELYFNNIKPPRSEARRFCVIR